MENETNNFKTKEKYHILLGIVCFLFRSVELKYPLEGTG